MVFDWLARRLVSGLHLNRFYLEALVWPKLAEDSVRRLAAAAISLCMLNPRFASVSRLPESPISENAHLGFESAHVLIEQEIARGYGLTSRMLEEMFASDRTDRRGFWRYFDREPRAVSIARRVVDQTPGMRVLEPVWPLYAGLQTLVSDPSISGRL
jgi:hypothetical protein